MMPLRRRSHRAVLTTALTALTTLAALGAGGCGSSSSGSTSPSATASVPAAATKTSAGAPTPASTATSSSAAAPAPAVDELAAAERTGTDGFPAAAGRSLQALARGATAQVSVGAATGTFTPGTRRYAFALITSTGRYVYAPTVLYLATTPTSPAQGPFAAPADPMTVAPRYRSEQNAGPGGIAAIYAAQLPLPRAGTYTLLSLTRTSAGTFAGAGELAVAARSPIPDVGQRPPDIATDTAASVHGDVGLLTTRLPPEQMASVSLDQVLGHRPVALLFSTPQLCTSRVCGPVTDVTVSLQHEFGDRVAFIHQEVYVDNDPAKGLRPQMHAFHLQTEPWLFAIDRHGVIVARLEGAFGTAELTRALQAASR